MFKESGKNNSYSPNLKQHFNNASYVRVYEETGASSTEKLKNVLTSSRTIVATLTEVGSNAALNFLFAFFRRAWQSGQLSSFS